VRKHIPQMSDMDAVTTRTPGPVHWVEGPPQPLPDIVYMPSRYRPARLVPPGRTIAAELEARGWTQRNLAEAMGCPEETVSGIVDRQEAIAPETARQLAKAFGTSVEFWVNLEANYRQHISGQIMPRIEMVGRLMFVGKGPTMSPLTLCGQSLEDILLEESGRFGKDLGLVRLTVEWLDGEEAPLG